MAQQIINIGTEAGSGDGDDLRVAFDKVNQNFTEIYSGNVVSSDTAVSSVAGRTGDIELTVVDVLGAASTGDITNVRLAMAANSAADRAYADTLVSGLTTDFANVEINGGTLANVQISGTSWASLSNLTVAGTTYTNRVEVSTNALVGGNIGLTGWINFNDGSKLNSATSIDVGSVNANVAAANLAISALQSNAGIQGAQINALNANIAAANVAINALGAFDVDDIYANLAVQTANSAVQSLNISQANYKIGLINANVTASNLIVSGIDGRVTTLESNAATQGASIATLLANAGTQGASITALESNAASQAVTINTLVSNAVAQHARLDVLTANAAAQSLQIDTLTANAATQTVALSALTANAATQATQLASKANLTDASFTGNIAIAGTLDVTGNTSMSFVDATKVSASQLAGTITTPNQINITRVGTLGFLDVTGNVTAANLTGTLLTAAQPNITQVGTLGTLSVTGNVATGNVSGTKGTFTNVQGTLLTASQTNITQVGTLVSLGVTGNVGAGNVSGTKGTFTNVQGTLLTAAQPNITQVGTLATLTVTGAVSTGNLSAGNVSTTKLTATTVEGTLSTSAQPNITEIGTLDSLDVDGNISVGGTLLLSNPNVIFSAPKLASNLVTANYATITQNVSGNTATFTGNIGAGNVSTTKLTATVVGATSVVASTAEITTITATGNVSAGNVSTTKLTATSIEGTLLTSVQPNIVELGTLVALTVTGNVDAGNVNADYGRFTTIGGILEDGFQPNITSVGTLDSLTVDTTISAGNVQADLGTFNEVEGVLLTNAQPNVTEVGTLTGLAVDGAVNITGAAVVGDSLYVTGNLYVSGNSTTVDSESVTTSELTITVANGAVNNTAADGAGIIVATANASITYDATSDSWVVNKTLVGSANVFAEVGQFDLVGGTLQDAFQPNITTVGTLVALEVAGNVVAENLTISDQIEVANKIIFGDGTEQITAFNEVTVLAQLSDVNANVAAANVAISGLESNAASQATDINTLFANAAFQGNAINWLEDVISDQEGIHNDLYANAAGLSTEINELRANVTAANSAIGSLESALLSNAAGQSVEINELRANVAAANAVVASFESNAATQASAIADLFANAATQDEQIQARANIADPTFTGTVGAEAIVVSGNVSVGNISGGTATFDNFVGTITTTGGAFSGNVTAGNVIVSGQVEADKVIATGNISTTADVSGFNAYFENSIYGTIGTQAQPNIRSVGALFNLTIVGNIDSVDSIHGIGSAEFAELYGTLKTNAQPNITQVGTLVDLDVTGNVATGNVSGTKGTFTELEGTLLTGDQSNITQVGTLVDLDVTGNASVGNLSTTGTVIANNVAGTLLTPEQPNITQVGTLVDLDVTGNVSAGNLSAVGGTLEIDHIVATGNADITGTLVVTSIETNNITATGTGAVNLGPGSLTAATLNGNLNGYTASLSGTDESTSTSTGALTVIGGAGIGGNAHVGGLANIGGTLDVGGDTTLDGELSVTGNVTMGTASGTNQIYGSINWHDTNFDATQSAIALFTTTVTQIEFGLAAQDIEIGASLGNTTINHGLVVNGNIYGSLGDAASTSYVNNNLAVVNNTLTNDLDVTNIADIGNLNVTGSTVLGEEGSSSAVTGALVVPGGVGIVGGLNVGVSGAANSTVILNGTTNSSTSNNGALQVKGGAGIVGNLSVAGFVNLASTSTSVSTTTGAVRIAGGVGIVKDVNVGGNLTVFGDTTFIGDVTIPTVILASLNDTPIGNAIPSSGQFTTLSTVTRRPKGRPTLNLDFVNAGALDTRVTFTRNSPATYVNRFGNIVIAANNQPRFTHDAYLQAQGLMIEEERTNLYSRSSEFDHADWSALDATVTSNPFVGPGPAEEVYFIQEGSNTGAHGFAATTPPTVTGATLYTASIFAKSGPNRTQISLIFTGEGTATVFDLNSGTIESEGASYRSSIELFANSWYRCSSTVSKTNTSGNVVVALANGGSSSYTGDGASGAYVYGFQFEQGEFATSYIPTTSTGAVRLAEEAYITGSSLDSFHNTTVGSLYIDAQVGYRPTTFLPNNKRPVLVSFDDSTADNRIQLLAETKSTATRYANLVVYTDGVLQANIGDTGNLVTIDSGKITTYYREDTFGLSLNGNLMVNDISGNISGGINRMQLGGGVGADPLNGTISKIMYWPLIITNSEAQELSRQ